MKESRKHSILHQIIPLFYRKKKVAKNLSIMSIEETVYIENTNLQPCTRCVNSYILLLCSLFPPMLALSLPVYPFLSYRLGRNAIADHKPFFFRNWKVSKYWSMEVSAIRVSLCTCRPSTWNYQQLSL